MNTSKHIEEEDKISLFSLIDLVVSKIYYVIGITTILSLLGFIYLQNSESEYVSIIPFKQVDQNSLSNFLAINNILDDFEENSGISINSEKVFELFLTEFSSKQAFYDIYFNNYKNEIKDISKLNKKIFQEIKKFRVEGTNNLLFPYFIQFNTNKPDQDIENLKQGIKKINFLVYKKIVQELSTFSSTLKTKKQESIKQLENKLKIQENSYKQNLKIKIKHLEEHAAIARSLNISDNDSHFSISGVEIVATEFDYLRGYTALEKEINILQKRDSALIAEYDQIYADILTDIIREKTNFQDYERLEIALNNTNGDTFRSIDINLDQANFNKVGQPKIIILFVIIICSFLISSICVIFYTNYLVYRNNLKK